MKKIFLTAISAVALAGVVRAAGSSTDYGVMAISNAAKRALIAIPWESTNPGGGDVAISNLVLTSNLQVGDELHVIDSAGKDLNSWQLTKDSQGVLYWQAPTKQVTESEVKDGASADKATAKKGAAVILIRNRNDIDATKPIYVMGQVATNAPSATITANGYNLIAPPSVVAQKINGDAELGGVWTGTINANDRIYLNLDNGFTPELKYDAGKWKILKSENVLRGGKIVGVKRSWQEYTETIPVGRGFWYYSAGGTPTVTWTHLPKKDDNNTAD